MKRREKIIYKEKIIKRDTIPMYIIKTLDLTNWLCSQGYRILKVEDSEQNPRFKVFLFEDSEELRITVGKYLSHRRKGV